MRRAAALVAGLVGLLWRAGLLAGSLALVWQGWATFARDPALTILRVASAEEIVAATGRAMASAATPERLEALLAARLAEEPRNWVALEALAEVFAERGVVLPDSYQAAWDEDNGLLARAGACGACAIDIAQCSMTNVLVCKGPILLTPVEDVLGLGRAATAALGEGEVDELDLALSVAGLAATGAVVVSGGSSASVKAGTAAIKAARGMGRLSARLTDEIVAAFRASVDLAALRGVRSMADLRAAVRGEALAPVARLAADVGRIGEAAGVSGTLHLIRLADSGAEARQLADAATALGPRVVGRAEVLGKGRLFRATVRVGNAGLQLAAGIAGALIALAGALGQALAGVALRGLRRRR